jgi:hypothetical protein
VIPDQDNEPAKRRQPAIYNYAKVSVLLRNRMSHSINNQEWRNKITAVRLEKTGFSPLQKSGAQGAMRGSNVITGKYLQDYGGVGRERGCAA